MATNPAPSPQSDLALEPDPPANEKSAKSAAWTPEKRAALSAKMKEKHQAVSSQGGEEADEVPEQLSQSGEAPSSLSPFALSDEHEFPTSPTRLPAGVDRVDIYSSHPGSELTLIDSIPVPPPALPGTPLSPYRRCPCLAVLPGRVCTFCYGTHWTKLCQKCEGEGRIHLSVRKGAERSQPCGHCGGRGTLPANMREISEATRLAEEFAAGPAGRSLIVAVEAPEFRRAVKLPGIGVTATKRTGTISARKRERLRNETRKQQRNGTRTVATT